MLRTADAQAVVDKLLKLNDSWNMTVSRSNSMLESLIKALQEQKDAERDTQVLLREMRDLLIEDHRRRK